MPPAPPQPPAQPPAHFWADVVTFGTFVSACVVVFIFLGGCFYLDSLLAIAKALGQRLYSSVLAPAGIAALGALEKARVAFVTFLQQLGIGQHISSALSLAYGIVPQGLQAARFMYDAVKYRVDDVLRGIDATLRAALPGPMDALGACGVALGQMLGRAWALVLQSCGYVTDKVAQQYQELAEQQEKEEAPFAAGRAGDSSTPAPPPPPPPYLGLFSSAREIGGFTPTPKRSWVPRNHPADAYKELDA